MFFGSHCHDAIPPQRGSEARLPGEARAVELVRTVSSQVREMEASGIEDQGGQINHVSARQGEEGSISSGLLLGRPSHRDSRAQSRPLGALTPSL